MWKQLQIFLFLGLVIINHVLNVFQFLESSLMDALNYQAKVHK